MSTSLPQTAPNWKLSQDSDKLGDIVRTRNLDFIKAGFVTLARKAIGLFSKNENANFGTPLAITNDNNNYYVLTTTGAFIYNPGAQTITQLSVVGDPPVYSVGSDQTIFNNQLLVTGQTTANTYDLVTQVWTHPAVITGLNSAYPHPVETFVTLAYVCVADGRTVKMYDSTYALVATLTIEMGFVITGLKHVPGFMYIATRNIYGKNARMFVWAGTYDGSANGTGAVSYDAEGDWIYSMDEYDASIAIINSLGQLMRFNGNGFDQLDALPVYNSDYSWVSSAAVASLIGKVVSRGMRSIGKRIVLNIDGSLSLPSNQYPGKVMPNQPSGVWVYDPNVGLGHRAGYVHESHQSVAVDSVDSSYLVLHAAVSIQTGDAVVMPITTLTGLNGGQTYFAIVDGTQNIRLALSPYDAVQGNYIPVSGTPGGFDILHVDNYSSVGATLISNPGPIHPIATILPNIFFGDEFLFAGEAINGSGAAIGVLMSLGMGRNVGSFTTARIPASSLTDTFTKIFAKLEPLYLAGQYITIKFRTQKKFGMPMSTTGLVTWASSTTFTISTATRDFSAVSIGDEIEIIQGAGSGYTAQVAGIDTSTAPILTVTLDKAIPGAVNGKEFDFIVDNWTLLELFDKNGKAIPEGFLETAVGPAAVWAQFKVELGGFKTEMTELDIPTTGDMNFN